MFAAQAKRLIQEALDPLLRRCIAVVITLRKYDKPLSLSLARVEESASTVFPGGKDAGRHGRCRLTLNPQLSTLPSP